MAPGISYDDSGSLASYFGVTFLALLLLPLTYVVFRPSTKGKYASGASDICSSRLFRYEVKSLLTPVDTPKPLCPCSTCRERASQLSSLESGRRRSKFWRRILPLLLGWAFFVFLCYRISQAPPIEGNVVYNPFEILGLSDSSTEKQIKKHYKKLSLLL